MPATINDIAKYAGVSAATVSRVLNGTKKVNEETRSRVEEAIRKYSYKPSAIARGLKTKSMKNIAIVVARFTQLHHMKIASEINRYFMNLNYDVVMYEAESSEESVLRFLSRMVDKAIDGIIFIGSAFQVLIKPSEEVSSLLASIPVIIANGYIEGAHGITIDEGYGMKLIVDHLYSTGRRNFIYLKDSNTLSAQNKLSGFIKEAEKQKVDSYKILDTDCTVEALRKTFEENKEIIKAADAIVSDEDIMAIGVVKVLSELGYKIPEEKAVTGFNNSEYSTLSYPEITTIDNKASEQGRICAEILESILQNNEIEAEKEIIPEIIIRESSI